MNHKNKQQQCKYLHTSLKEHDVDELLNKSFFSNFKKTNKTSALCTIVCVVLEKQQKSKKNPQPQLIINLTILQHDYDTE